MKTLEEIIWYHGSWLQKGMTILSQCSPLQVLPGLYDLPVIEQYLKESEAKLCEEIIEALSGDKSWKDTGEPFKLDSAFFSTYLGQGMGLKNFKTHIEKRKFSINQLIDFHNKMCIVPEFDTQY